MTLGQNVHSLHCMHGHIHDGTPGSCLVCTPLQQAAAGSLLADSTCDWLVQRVCATSGRWVPSRACRHLSRPTGNEVGFLALSWAHAIWDPYLSIERHQAERPGKARAGLAGPAQPFGTGRHTCCAEQEVDNVMLTEFVRLAQHPAIEGVASEQLSALRLAIR